MSHDYYLWMSYGMTALVLVAELFALRMRATRAWRRVREERELESQD